MHTFSPPILQPYGRRDNEKNKTAFVMMFEDYKLTRNSFILAVYFSISFKA